MAAFQVPGSLKVGAAGSNCPTMDEDPGPLPADDDIRPLGDAPLHRHVQGLLHSGQRRNSCVPGEAASI